MFNLFRKKNKIILDRFSKDPITKQRLKYNPYYLFFDKQEGSNVWLNGQKMIMLSSNDYLGLSNHPRIIEKGIEALKIWGSSTTGARLSNGSRSYHVKLEEELADFLGMESCQVLSAGYLACMASIQSFAKKDDLILVDRNVHSSLWSGILLTQAKVERFSHNNFKELEEILNTENPSQPKFLIIEGVYSMEGHIAPIPDLINAVKDHNCVVIVDDAHGFGVLGNQGRGTVDHFNCTDKVDIIAGSFSKALSSIGGFVAGSKSMIEYLRSYSKQTIFSAAIPPAQAACAHEALKIMKSEPEHLKKLWENTKKYNQILSSLGLNTWSSESPAIPIVLGDKAKVYYFWQDLLSQGVFTVMSIAPAVPPGKDLIRTSISARHTDEDLEKIEKALKFAVKRL